MQPVESIKQIPALLSHLPNTFLQFLKDRKIPLEVFSVEPSRYFRLKPQCKSSLNELAIDIGMSIDKIHKVDDFYSIPSTQNIHQSKLYQSAELYGMDISSGYAVKALDVQDGQHILELCCAPGNKLMYIRDLVKGGSVTGVDISVPRMQITRNLLKKYGHEHTVSLFCQDALKFTKLPEGQEGYDRVLVDAECTHEGSLKHLKKFLDIHKQLKAQMKMPRKMRKQFQKNNTNPYTTQLKVKNQWTKQDFQQRFLDPKKLQQLQTLQKGLLQKGFQMLKVGGYLVYSTCSFDESQNQQIVKKFVQSHPNSQLVEAFSKEQRQTYDIKWQQSHLKGAVRFNPLVSNTGGLFIAKLLKK